MDINSIYDNNDPNTAMNQLMNMLFTVYDSTCPIKKKKLKKNLINEPWVTPRLKKCIRKKFLLFNLHRRGLISKTDFVWYKNLLRWVITKMRKLFYQTELTKCRNNMKNAWRCINGILQRSRQDDDVKQVKNDSGQVVVGNDMANYFNTFFTNVAFNLVANLPVDINYSAVEAHIQPSVQSCFFGPADDHEVNRVLYSMKNKGNQIYEIRPGVLVNLLNVIKVITFIYNLSISNGIYPDLLKISRTIPAFKSGDPENVSNYRPISNLSTINKVFELLTYNRMNDFIEKNKLLSDLQYGFRKGKSTNLAIFHLVSDFLFCFHQKTYTIALFLDLRKAFDTINKDILIHKLKLMGFRGITNDFINSYMTNRKQYVNVHNCKSNLEDISVSCPQGSVLGPLFFNLFINDITHAISFKKVLFADDGVFYVTAETLDECLKKILLVISQLSTYLKVNKLIPNTDKTKLMLITPRPVNELPDVYFDGKKLEWVNHIRYLGIQLDNKLNFHLQTADIGRKLSQMQGVIYSMATLVPRNSLINIFNALVLPIINQNILIWGGSNENNLRNIKIGLNNILRIILNVRRDENNVPLRSTNEMFKELNMLKLDDAYKLTLLKFLHYAFYKNSSLFLKYYSPLLPNHNYNTRLNRINLPNVRLEIERNSVIFQSCKLLNMLPESLIKPQHNTTLKSKFKRICIEGY